MYTPIHFSNVSLFCIVQLTADSYTIPEKAVIEHNMLATGRIYDNITFIELGSILRLDAQRAEKVRETLILKACELLKAIDVFHFSTHKYAEYLLFCNKKSQVILI